MLISSIIRPQDHSTHVPSIGQSELTPLSQPIKTKSKAPNSDRKYNLVVNGVKNCVSQEHSCTSDVYDNNEIAKMIKISVCNYTSPFFALQQLFQVVLKQVY